MNTSVQNLPAGAVQPRAWWAAAWLLAVAVLALGASVVYVMTRPADGHTAAAALEPIADADPMASHVFPPAALPEGTAAPDTAVPASPPVAMPSDGAGKSTRP